MAEFALRKLISPLVTPVLLLSACAVQNSAIRMKRGEQASPCSSSSRSNLASINEPSWIVGALSYTWYQLVVDPINPRRINEQCSGVFEFSQSATGYTVHLLTNHRCMEFFSGAPSGDLWIWSPLSTTRTSGYLKFRVKNDDSYNTMVEINRSLSDISERMTASDYFSSGLLASYIQSDIGFFLPTRVTDAAFYCGDPRLDAVDSPDPKGCVWPQSLQRAEFEVEAVDGLSTTADLDSLVSRTNELRERRAQDTLLPKTIAQSLESYQTDWDELQKLAVNTYRWQYLKSVFLNDTYGDNQPLRIAAAKAIGKYYLPTESGLINEALLTKLNEATTQEMLRRYDEVKYPYIGQLGKVIDRWKSIMAIMEDNKGALSLLANLPTPENSTEAREVPLFPTNGSSDPSLAGVHWAVKEKYLEVTFDAEQRILRRPMDTGSVILLGGYPILTVLRDNPHEDAGTMMPLPLPQPKAPSPTAPNCPK